MINSVYKFGGSSLSNAENVKKVKKILDSGDANFVIVSAMGKSFRDDVKITDLLIKCFEASKNAEDFTMLFEKIKFKITSLIDNLNVKIDFTKEFSDLENKILEHQDYDYVVSRGEYFNARILAVFFDYTFVDAKDIIKFTNEGVFDEKLSQENFNKICDTSKKYVIPGFYGSFKNKNIKVFSRGGSDITGAIMSKLSGAKMYKNYTDVDGFLIVDPHIIEKPKTISYLSYDEVRVLSLMGAKVLHEDCTNFLRENKIKLNLKNTFNPNHKGTIISNVKTKTLKGIAVDNDFIIIKVSINKSHLLYSVIDDLIKSLEKDFVVRFKFFIDDNLILVLKNNNDKILRISKIKKTIKCNKGEIQIFNNVSCVIVAGNLDSISNQTKILKAICNCNYKLLFITKMPSTNSILFGIEKENSSNFIKVLYDKLF